MKWLVFPNHFKGWLLLFWSNIQGHICRNIFMLSLLELSEERTVPFNLKPWLLMSELILILDRSVATFLLLTLVILMLILTITQIILGCKLIWGSLCRLTGQFKDFCKTTKMRKEDQQWSWYSLLVVRQNCFLLEVILCS